MGRSKKRRRSSARETAKKQTSGFTFTTISVPEGLQLYQPKAGQRRVEIIEYKAGKKNPMVEAGDYHYEMSFWVHRNIGSGDNAYVCPRKTFGGKCPICDDIAKLKQQGGNDDTIKALAPKHRQLWLIYDYSEEDRGLQLWDVSHHLFGKTLNTRITKSDEDDNYESFHYNDEDGMTLKLSFEEVSRGGYKFLEVDNIDFKQRGPLDEELYDHEWNLEDLLVVKDYDDLKNIYLQIEDEDEDKEEEEEEQPKTRRKKRKPEPEPDEDDDDDVDDFDEDEEEEEEEPEPKPKRKSKRRPKPEPEEEEDEEEEEDDWDEPEPKPKAKAKSKSKPKRSTKKRKAEPEEDEDDDDDIPF